MDVLDLLRKHSSLTVAGNAGCGKTALIRHLALRLMSEGFEIVPVIEPKTIVDFHDETKKQVFVLDDACGVHTVDHQKRTAWLDYGQVIQDCLLQSSAVLLVSVRLSIINNELFQDLKVLSQNVINLKEKKYALTLKNRQDIFRSHFQRGHEELGITVKSLRMHDSFPLLCRFSSSSFQTVAVNEKAPLVKKSDNYVNDLDNFFQTPIQVIESEIKSLKINSPMSYCVLVLCLLFNGKLPTRNLFYSNKHKSLLKDCFGVCGLNRGTSIKTLFDVAKSLTDVYLKEDVGTLMFIHDIIMDIVSACFGEDFPGIILKHADIEVIIKRAILEKINTDTTRYRIFIPEYHHFDFFQRLCTEIKKGNAWQVFNHCQLEIQWVQTAMASYLEKMSDDELRYLFFQVVDKEGDRHKKLRLKLIEIWAQIQDTKPVIIDCHIFLHLIVSNAFHWILGKGLFRILMLLERRVRTHTYNDLLKSDSLCTFIAILGGNVKTYDWILNVQTGTSLLQNICNKLFQKKNLMLDFKWAVFTGRTDIVEFLLNKSTCQKCLNKFTTAYDMMNITGKLYGQSVYKERIQLFWAKFVQKSLSILNLTDESHDYNIDNIIDYAEMVCLDLYREDERFNKLLFKKIKSDVEPIILKMYQRRVEFQCSQYPLSETIDDELFGMMEIRRTYLALAAFLGHESVVNLLIMKGANPNEISCPSNSVAKAFTCLPVVYAAKCGRLRILQSLLRNGAKIESTGPFGCTLLMLASSNGHQDLVRFLLDQHVDINATNMFQNTALLNASKNGHTDIVHLLLENDAIPTVCYKSSTPLIEASSGGHLEIVEKLLACYSSVNACDDKNMNALTKAAKNGHYTIVERLIENQAAVNIPTHKSESALMIACRKGHLMVVSILIKHMHECLKNRYIIMEKDCSTLEIEIRTAFSQLPYALCSPPITEESEEMNQALLVAYENKRVGIMKFLLDNGANVQIELCTSLSLLNRAVSEGEYEIVDLLLKNGAQVQKRANFGIPSLALASYRGHTDIVTVLLKNNANINSKADRLPIPLTSRENIWLQQKWNKSDLNNIETDNSGTALIYASLKGSLRLINSLLQDKNININSKTYMGRTALMIACGSGREEVVELLLRYNPDLNIRSKLGATVLDIAFMSRMGGTKIIRCLLQNGATISRGNVPFPEPNKLRTLRSEYLPKILYRVWFLLRFVFILVLSKLIVFC